MSTDYKNTLNWNTSPELDEIFTQSFVYDAMLCETARQNGVLSRIKSRQRSSTRNRPMQVTKPDATVESYTYNKAGLLETVHAQVKGATSVLAVTGISYNEKGQRTEIFYGNGSKTKYEYDEETFRLNRLLTTRNTGIDILQDINYTYDPVGNISQITDNAQQTHYYSNSVIAPTGTYTYDALYRLKTATGRELTSLQMPTNTDFVDNIALPNTASNAMQNYTQQYEYDELGNMMEMKSVDNWTRDYFYDFTNEANRLLGHTENTIEYSYDEHGNMLSMPHLSSMLWDYKDELKEITLNASNDTAYYVYDASGERVRKVIEKTGGIVEERVYLGGYEVYRKSVAGTIDFERETLHVSDDTKKIVSIETKTIESGNSITTPVSNIRYQYDNHLGSAALELDDTAAIISYEEYHPFGTTSYRSGRTETEVSLKRYKYVGKERDDETGLYYYGARYYAAWLCRFVSVDPLQFEYPHYTPFQYAGNKPIRYIDLDGLEEAHISSIDNSVESKNTISKEKFSEIKEFFKNNRSNVCIKVFNDAVGLTVDKDVQIYSPDIKKTYDLLESREYLTAKKDFPIRDRDNIGKYVNSLDFDDAKKGIANMAKWMEKAASQEKGIHVFRISISEGYHSIIGIIDNTEDKTIFYLADQGASGRGFVYNGIQEYTDSKDVNNVLWSVIKKSAEYYTTYEKTSNTNVSLKSYIFKIGKPENVEKIKSKKAIEIQIKDNNEN